MMRSVQLYFLMQVFGFTFLLGCKKPTEVAATDSETASWNVGNPNEWSDPDRDPIDAVGVIEAAGRSGSNGMSGRDGSDGRTFSGFGRGDDGSDGTNGSDGSDGSSGGSISVDLGYESKADRFHIRDSVVGGRDGSFNVNSTYSVNEKGYILLRASG